MLKAIPIVGRLRVGSFYKLPDMGIILALTLFQYGWVAHGIAQKTALVNLFPAIVLITMWTLFISHYYANQPVKRILLLLPLLVICLRLPETVSNDLQAINWLAYFVMAGTVVQQLLTSFPGRTEKIYLALAFAVLAMNAIHHLGVNSPYTYTYRTTNQVPSGFHGETNYPSWECKYYQQKYPVHCDAQHFVASELIFTDPTFNPYESVVLQRFLHGYLNSLTGRDTTRYWANLMGNIVFWFFACASIYRICLLLKMSRDIAGLSMLCCASGWGFVSMVAQPAPYMLAYAYASIAIWATLEIIYSDLDRRRSILFVILIASIIMIYDAYQMILVSVLLLFLHKKRYEAVSIFVLQFAFTLIWSLFSLQTVMGTQGAITSDSHSIANIALDINTWLGIVKSFNFSEAIHLGIVGLNAYTCGNLYIGVFAAWAYIFGLNRAKSDTPEQKTFLLTLLVLNLLVLASSIFIVPQMYHWAPGTGMQPRIMFYSFPINMIAFTLIVLPWLKKYAWTVPLSLMIIANINVSGLISIDMMFDYGLFGVFWK